MPLKLNVGLSKKQGLPDYGTVGASCHVDVELDGSILHGDLDAFHRYVRNAYVACSQAVNDELARHRVGESGQRRGQTPTNGNGATSHNGNGNGSHRASQKQIDYANQLARQIHGLGVRRLDDLAQRMFGKPAADLSGLDASSLIDTLKAIKDGRLDLDAALNGAAS